MRTIPIFTQRGGQTLASSTPRVTQLNAVRSVAAAWPQSVERPAQASASSGAARSPIHQREPRFAQPNEVAARIGTAINASHVSPLAVDDAAWMPNTTMTI